MCFFGSLNDFESWFLRIFGLSWTLGLTKIRPFWILEFLSKSECSPSLADEAARFAWRMNRNMRQRRRRRFGRNGS